MGEHGRVPGGADRPRADRYRTGSATQLHRAVPTTRRSDRGIASLEWTHVYLDGLPDARPPIPPHVEIWRSVREGGDTKTRKSRRILALPARCVQALRKQRAQQATDRLAAGAAWQETGLVFTTQVGTAMDAANVRRSFRRALGLVKEMDPKQWTPRELRHSFVSLLSDVGVPVEKIAQLVGHSGTTVTELVYRRQLRPVLQDAATVVDQLFKPDTGSGVDRQLDRQSQPGFSLKARNRCLTRWAILGSNQ